VRRADKKDKTTPDKAKAGDSQSMNDFGDPADGVNPNGVGRTPGGPGGPGAGAARPAAAG